MTHISVK